MKSIYLTLFFVISCLSMGVAQQRTANDLHRENWLVINPASFSSEYLLQGKTQNISLSGRYQWTALDNPPHTIGLQYQNILEDYNFAFGASLLNDQAGAIGNLDFRLNGAYQMKFGGTKTQFLSIGLSAALIQYRVDFAQITFSEPNANLPTDNQLKYYPDFSMGLFYYLDKTLYFGVSVPQIFNLNTGQADAFATEVNPYFFGNIGGFIPVSSSKNSYLEPSVIVKYVEGLPINTDLYLRYNHQTTFWLGGGYNLVGGIHFDAGFYIPVNSFKNEHLKVGIGYTYRADNLRAALGETFEVSVGYSWGRSQLVKCPSF